MAFRRTPVLSCSILTAILVSCMPVTGPTPPVPAALGAQAEPGRVETFTYWDGERVKRQMIYRSLVLDDSAPVSATNPVVTVLQSTMPGPGMTETVPTATASEAEVRTFLRDHWDAYVGGKDDVGLNHQEFLQLLGRNGLTIPQFLQLWRGSRLTLADFDRFLQRMDQAMGDADHPVAVQDLYRALDTYRLSLGQLVAALAKVPLSGYTVVPLPEAAVTSFFQRLQADRTTVSGFLALAVASQTGLTAAVADLLAMRTQATAPLRNFPVFIPGGGREPWQFTMDWQAVAAGKLTGTTGAILPEFHNGYPTLATGNTFYTNLRRITAASGATVLQWRLYAKGVAYVVRGSTQTAESAVPEIGVDSLSVADARYNVSIYLHTVPFPMDGHPVDSWVEATLDGGPGCSVFDKDSISLRQNGLVPQWETVQWTP